MMPYQFTGQVDRLMLCIAAVACSPLAPRPNCSKSFILTPITRHASPAALRMTAVDFRLWSKEELKFTTLYPV
jgi:hypothetical protein